MMQNMQQIFDGLTQDDLNTLERTIDQLFATKSTSNDIIYNEFFNDSQIDNQPISHKIIMYDNDIPLNNYLNKEQFFKQFQEMQNKLDSKKKYLKNIEKEETIRIIKEYEHKNYEKKYGNPIAVILSALLGPQQAELEIFKHGINRKQI
ncbi:hypothetical protein IMG5_123140 [Ichthyophthirius multifiliis]|uniref:Uncharacterized protein n=1 Tax=Ichthyophthirius multifiliis TaxID=5932 RepID=G0QVE3_ICHMU|nr:hypothetical protein IMG5_123140 [Ichthyophthirius multifiliis]EGR30800.1 hypothetical protein IMG5_123140 [Ichthyophthirius multifiliis]|eukprot:XP_004032387.1 hypothetical protein IMG5_123140 [Ichthyophthirius multifiliis]